MLMFPGPDVTVVALEPSEGPVPPPIKVVVPLDSAAYACCGEMKWICVSMPAAVRIRCAPEMASVARPISRPGVIRSIVCGLPDLPMPQMRPSLMPTIGLHHAQHRVDDRHVGDDEVGRPARARHLVVHAHAFAHALAAAEDDLVAVAAAQVALDLDEQPGVAQADAIADRGAE